MFSFSSSLFSICNVCATEHTNTQKHKRLSLLSIVALNVVCASYDSFPKAEHINIYTTHAHAHQLRETLNRSGIRYGPNTGIADEIWNGTLCVGVMCVCVYEGIPVARCSLVYARNRMEVKPNVKREHRKIEAQKEAQKEEEEKRMRGCYAQCFGMKQTWNGNQ